MNVFQQFLSTQFDCVNLNNLAKSGFDSRDLLQQLRQDPTTQQAVKKADIITISIGGGNLIDCVNTPTIGCLTLGVVRFFMDWPRILNEIRNSIESQAQILVMTAYNPLRGDDPRFGFVDFFIQLINHVIKNSIFRSIFNYKVADVYTDFQGQFPDGTWKVCEWTHFCENQDVHPTDSGHQEIARLHELIFS